MTPPNGELTQLFYDDLGLLFAIERERHALQRRHRPGRDAAGGHRLGGRDREAARVRRVRRPDARHRPGVRAADRVRGRHRRSRDRPRPLRLPRLRPGAPVASPPRIPGCSTRAHSTCTPMQAAIRSARATRPAWRSGSASTSSASALASRSAGHPTRTSACAETRASALGVASASIRLRTWTRPAPSSTPRRASATERAASAWEPPRAICSASARSRDGAPVVERARSAPAPGAPDRTRMSDTSVDLSSRSGGSSPSPRFGASVGAGVRGCVGTG